jgi:hypothetical protein
MSKSLISIVFLVGVLLLTGGACGHQPTASVTFNISSSVPIPDGTTVVIALTDPLGNTLGPVNVSPTNGTVTGTVNQLAIHTTYGYTISASGYVPASGTFTTGANGSNTTVNVQLQPEAQQLVTVEFRTSANLASGALATNAQITVTPGNFGTIDTQPVANQSYYAADVPGFTAGVLYSYSAFFTQFGQTITGTFTPRVSAGAPFEVDIAISPPSSTIPSKALPSGSR